LYTWKERIVNKTGTLLAAACALILASCVSTPGSTKPAAAEPTAAQPATPVAVAEPDVADLIEKGDTAGLQALFKTRDMVGKVGADGRYPLHAAVGKKSSEMVGILLAMGADPDPLDADGKTPLRYAVDSGDAASAKLLTQKGASLFAADKAGVTPLDTAIAKGFTPSLLDRASVATKSAKAETALHIAVDRLSIDAVRAILALDPDLAARDDSGRTPLDSAFLHPGNSAGAAIAEILVTRNAPSGIDEFSYFVRAVRDTNYARARFADGATVLHEAVRFDHRGYLSFFLDRSVPVDAKNASGATALHDAIRQTRLEAAKILLLKGADPKALDGSGNTPLHLALTGDKSTAALELLLSSGADPSIKDKGGNTALHLAVAIGYEPESAGKLIAGGAPIDAANSNGDTALTIAARLEYNTMVAALASKGANIFIRNIKSQSPLSIALSGGAGTARALLAASARNARDDSGDSPYHHAVRQEADPAVIGVMKELGLDPSSRNNDGDTALHIAAGSDASGQGEALIAAGSDPFAVNGEGETPLSIALKAPQGPLGWFFPPSVLAAVDGSGNGPLHYAAMAGLAQGVSFIAARGVEVDSRNKDGQTPLLLALKNDSTDTVNALLTLGADPDTRDASGATALHLAVYWNSSDCLKLLARSAGDLDPRDFTGKTPLRDAVDKMDAAATAFLLERGADPLARDNSGETPLHAAARQSDQRYATALASKARRLDTRDDSGATPLLEAIYAENAKSAKVLTNAGSSIMARDATGESPLSYALKKGGAILGAVLDDKTARSLDADGHSVLRVIVDTKPSAELVERALAAGASPDDRDAFGRSPLFVAVSKGFLDLVELLYAAGADPFARDAAGETPASLALAAGDDAIRAMFGKDPDAADYLGETALHHAAAAGLTKAAQSMLALGANTALVNAAGETAAEVATRRGHAELAVILSAGK
jgi:ankyrin repeat protein